MGQQGWTQSHHSFQRKASSDQVKYKPTALVRAMRSPVVHFVLLSTFFFSSQSFPTTNLQSEEPATTPEPEPEPLNKLGGSKLKTTEAEPEPDKAYDSLKTTTTEPTTTSEPEPEPEK